MADSPRLRILTGHQLVDGVPADCVLDHDAGEVILADGGDPGKLLQAAFEAGREWERDGQPEDMGELIIDDPVNPPPSGE